MLKVLAYGFEESEINHFRLREPLAELKRQGLADYRSTPSMQFPSWRNPQEVVQAGHDSEWADILFTQRYTQSSQVELIRHLLPNMPWVLDIDDHILAVDPEKNAYEQYRERPLDEIGDVRYIDDISQVRDGERCYRNSSGKLAAVKPTKDDCQKLTRMQILAADALIVGTHEMSIAYREIRRKYAKDRLELGGIKSPANLIYTIPYSVDPKRWRDLPKPPDHSPEVWIGWIGADEHDKDLVAVTPAIEHVLAEHPNVSFFWKRAHAKGLERLAMEYPGRCMKFERWAPHDEWPSYCSLSGFDIHIAPLVSTPFNDCRSPMKWVEAAMLKRPCVCSRTVGYQEAVHNRKSGYLCSRTKDWIAALEELIDSKEKRAEMGNAAYESAMKDFNQEVNAPMYLDAFTEVAERCTP